MTAGTRRGSGRGGTPSGSGCARAAGSGGSAAGLRRKRAARRLRKVGTGAGLEGVLPPSIGAPSCGLCPGQRRATSHEESRGPKPTAAPATMARPSGRSWAMVGSISGSAEETTRKVPRYATEPAMNASQNRLRYQGRRSRWSGGSVMGGMERGASAGGSFKRRSAGEGHTAVALAIADDSEARRRIRGV